MNKKDIEIVISLYNALSSCDKKIEPDNHLTAKALKNMLNYVYKQQRKENELKIRKKE